MSQGLEDRLKELEGLAPLAPPAALEERTLAAMDAAAVAAARPRSYAATRAAAVVAAAGIGLVLAAIALNPEPEPTATPGTGGAAATPLYTELAAEAAYLEEVLAAMPQRHVMRVSTAGTIAGLEDQIAVLDAELGRAEAPDYRTLLMHNRVEVMNALVNVRYSQSTAFAY
jgi:hypothetical protein